MYKFYIILDCGVTIILIQALLDVDIINFAFFIH